MISIARQLVRVQLQIQGESNRLEQVCAKKSWPEPDIEMKRNAIEELEAVAVTLRWLLENEAMVKQRIAA